jgi:hypothetical protein
MLDVEYLYIGGPYDGTWRWPYTTLLDGAPASEVYPTPEGEQAGTYIATKFGHMAGFGEGRFRMSCVVMLDEPWHTILSSVTERGTKEHGYRRRLERAIVHQAFREHLQRTWRVPEAITFGSAWEAMERRPQ